MLPYYLYTWHRERDLCCLSERFLWFVSCPKHGNQISRLQDAFLSNVAAHHYKKNAVWETRGTSGRKWAKDRLGGVHSQTRRWRNHASGQQDCLIMKRKKEEILPSVILIYPKHIDKGFNIWKVSQRVSKILHIFHTELF